jgi:DNA mismatch endonuclease (patch repair protein)
MHRLRARPGDRGGIVTVVDRLSPERRSWLMSRVGGKNTKPEMKVRKAAHALGLRFRLHVQKLAGRPDLVFPKHQAVVFVHGCFWHRHPGCKKASFPKSREEFWQAKFDANVQRDARVASELSSLGWRVVTIWECETKQESLLNEKLQSIDQRALKTEEERL